MIVIDDLIIHTTNLFININIANSSRMPRRRGNGFSTVETQSLLDAIEKYLPIGNVSWGRVTTYHASRFPAQERTTDSLRRKFSTLYRQNIRTGDPKCPEEVRRAKHLQSDIKKKSELSTAESDEDDSYEEEEEEEGWNGEEEGEEVGDYDSVIVDEEDEEDGGGDEDDDGGGGNNMPHVHQENTVAARDDDDSLLEPVWEHVVRVPLPRQEQHQVNTTTDTNQNISANPSSINKSTTAASHLSTTKEGAQNNLRGGSTTNKKKSMSVAGSGTIAQQGNQKRLKSATNGTVGGGSGGVVKFGKSSGTVVQKGARKRVESKMKNAGDDDGEDDVKFKDVIRMMIHQKEMEDVRYQREMEMRREDSKLAREQHQRLMDVLVMTMMSNNQRTGAQAQAAVPSPHGTYLTNTIQSPTLHGAPLQHVSFPPQQFTGIRGEGMFSVGRPVTMTESLSVGGASKTSNGSSTGNNEQNDDFGDSTS